MAEENSKKVVVEISLVSVIKILLLLLAIGLLYLVKDILIILLVVAIIATALEPFVQKLSKQGVPRALSVIVLYLALLIIVGIFVSIVVPPVVSQVREMTLHLPTYTERLNQLKLGITAENVNSIISRYSTHLSTAAGGVVDALVSVFGGVVTAVTIFALTYYFLVEEEGIRKTIARLIPVQHKARFASIVEKVSDKLGRWLTGQLALMAIVGILDGAALGILGVKFALALGVLSGFLEVVPVIGPILAGLTAVIVAFISGAPLWKILVIVAVYVLVQQLENQVLVPKIMQKAIGLSPVIVIIAILIGIKLLGLGGALLAVPVAAGIQVFVAEYYQLTKS